MNSPCFTCKHRFINCHTDCEKYREHKNIMEIIHQKIQQENEFEYYLIDATFRQKEGRGVVRA